MAHREAYCPPLPLALTVFLPQNGLLCTQLKLTILQLLKGYQVFEMKHGSSHGICRHGEAILADEKPRMRLLNLWFVKSVP